MPQQQLGTLQPQMKVDFEREISRLAKFEKPEIIIHKSEVVLNLFTK